jgi:hypothetical protein
MKTRLGKNPSPVLPGITNDESPAGKTFARREDNEQDFIRVMLRFANGVV